ncbi:MAG: winged helix-turn-helix domain-containing protein [Candidatus Aenigmarchaeota archaeon]|nr:winged helix-turn-helix domain-containing protein [Candidatus Aenigmarchaeota archaeon]
MAINEENDKSLFLRVFGDHPKLRIIDFLLHFKLFDMSKKEMMEGSGLSRGTFFKHFKDLEMYGLVKVTRAFGMTKLYKLNEESPVVKTLIKLDFELSKKYAESVFSMPEQTLSIRQ